MSADFAKAVRDMCGVSVQSLGTRPIRLQAYPRGTNWQGWYAQGRTRQEAYENLVRVLCGIRGTLDPRAGEAPVEDLVRIARKTKPICVCRHLSLLSQPLAPERECVFVEREHRRKFGDDT